MLKQDNLLLKQFLFTEFPLFLQQIVLLLQGKLICVFLQFLALFYSLSKDFTDKVQYDLAIGNSSQVDLFV